MVTTRAQEASTSQAVERIPQAEQSEDNLHVLPPAPPQVSQFDRLDALAHQVQDLMTVVWGLQEHCFAASPGLPQPPPLREEGHEASPPHQGRTPLEASHHSSPRPRRRETSRRDGPSPTILIVLTGDAMRKSHDVCTLYTGGPLHPHPLTLLKETRAKRPLVGLSNGSTSIINGYFLRFFGHHRALQHV